MTSSEAKDADSHLVAAQLRAPKDGSKRIRSHGVSRQRLDHGGWMANGRIKRRRQGCRPEGRNAVSWYMAKSSEGPAKNEE